MQIFLEEEEEDWSLLVDLSRACTTTVRSWLGSRERKSFSARGKKEKKFPDVWNILPRRVVCVWCGVWCVVCVTYFLSCVED